MDPPPRAVLLDQNLDHPTRGGPLAKGTDLIPRLRDVGFTGNIVMKSANSSSQDRMKYLAAGADGVIDKGVRMASFSRELAAILHYSEAAAAAAGEAAPKEMLDPAVLRALDADEANERVRGFRDRGGALASDAVTALASDGDAGRSWTLVFKLKALADFVGARRLARMCEDAEAGLARFFFSFLFWAAKCGNTTLS